MMDITLLVISLVSLVVAATMSLVVWRMMRDEGLRSKARVAALAAEIHEDPIAVYENVPRQEVVEEFLLRGTSPAAGEMFSATPPRSRLPLIATIAAVIAGVVAATILFGGPASRPVAADAQSPSARPMAVAPLELVALGHERDADGLTVRGVLRNPSSGTEISHLTAVVLLFNRDGGYVGSGRAVVQAATLGPGGETTFVVTVSGAPEVERYRVSFRTEDDVVPHVDRRS
jgi:hypothetical protein